MLCCVGTADNRRPACCGDLLGGGRQFNVRSHDTVAFIRLFNCHDSNYILRAIEKLQCDYESENRL
jgi:hypothetical protein